MASLLDVLMGLAPKPKNKEARNLSGPLPELVRLEGEEENGWTVKRTTRLSGVALKERTMYVPFETSPHALQQRVHALGHVALTPETADFAKDAKKVGVSPLMMESIEDARVNASLMDEPELRPMYENAAFDMKREEVVRLLQGLPMWVQRLTDPERLALGASLYLACANTPNEQLGEQLAQACGLPVEPLQNAAEAVKGRSYDEAREIVGELWQQLQPPPMPSAATPEPGDGAPGDSSPDGKPSGSGGAGTKPPQPKSTEAKPEEKKPEEKKPEPPKPPKPPPPPSEITQEWRDSSVFAPVIAPSSEALKADVKSGGDGDGDGEDAIEEALMRAEHQFNFVHIEKDGHGAKIPLSAYTLDASWGTMKVEELPLTVALKRPKRHQAKKKRSYDDGGRLGQVHRLRLDGKVFKRKAPDRTRQRIGTLLLDASGSMSITAADIERMLERAPQATIAMYSGFQHPSEPQYHGKLWILAKKRRRCAETALAPLGKTGGNVVDGPALRWLAQQPGPRIWVSDGGVTGRNDGPGLNIIRDVKTIMRAGKILQVPSIETLFQDAENVPEWINIAVSV